MQLVRGFGVHVEDDRQRPRTTALEGHVVQDLLEVVASEEACQRAVDPTGEVREVEEEVPVEFDGRRGVASCSKKSKLKESLLLARRLVSGIGTKKFGRRAFQRLCEHCPPISPLAEICCRIWNSSPLRFRAHRMWRDATEAVHYHGS
jgi:hypothetical protein